MGKQLPQITPVLNDFIIKQLMFFVGTAASDGRVNVSPKGMDSLRVLNPNTVAWLNVTGSGNESAAHVLVNPRMTLMFCAFEGAPMILRLYGKGSNRASQGRRMDGIVWPVPAASGRTPGLRARD